MSKRNVAPLGITQTDLDRFQQLEADRKEIGQQYEDLKAEFVAKTTAGAPIQEGPLTLDVNESKRKFPAWQEAYIRTNGQAAADALIEATEEKPVITVDVHRRSRFAR